MAVRTRTQLEAEYNNPTGGSFPTNTTQYIGSAQVRAQSKDLSDSLFNLTDDKYIGAAGLKPGLSSTNATAIATIKAITTVGLSVGVFVVQRLTDSSDILRIYELVAGTTADSGFNIIRPTDYAAATNEEVWRRCRPSLEDIPSIETVLDSGGSSAGGFNITDLAGPVNPDDASTKSYVDSAISSSGVLVADITISSANVLTSYNSPVQLIAAPGAGKIIVPLYPIILSLDYNSIAYATNTNCYCGWGIAGSDKRATETATSFLAATADRTRLLGAYTGNTAAHITGAYANASFDFTTDVGNPTAGNSPVRVVVIYKIITL